MTAEDWVYHTFVAEPVNQDALIIRVTRHHRESETAYSRYENLQPDGTWAPIKEFDILQPAAVIPGPVARVQGFKREGTSDEATVALVKQIAKKLADDQP